MPRTEVIFYKDTNGNAPVVLWLEELRETNEKAYAKCDVFIDLLIESTLRLVRRDRRAAAVRHQQRQTRYP